VADDVRHQIVELLPRLRRFAYVLTGDADRGDDLVQETCVRALSRLDQWEQGTRLDSWMYRIAQNAWIDRARSQKVRSELVDTDTTTRLACEDGRQVIENRIALREVFDAIALLPPDQKIAVALVCVEGLSYRRAAETLQIPMGTLMSRLARARQALYIAIHGQPDTVLAKVE
jgi:RNA polymerase sigma-70 factor (ECF subfamily)